MAGRHVHTAREGLDVEGLRIFAIDAIADMTHDDQLAEVFVIDGLCQHISILPRTGDISNAVRATLGGSSQDLLRKAVPHG
ncbi:hypothetical protein GCM10007269_22340 [Microbacterium murale]|uniref:Uncharacterized protein n=1 Tax=Microbacterium murale TaxID=1081040 RepID=A0ABQ1RVL0_9MICO|nr:hypothetical protein GCM10007269_22340 [Microbacterium murale]